MKRGVGLLASVPILLVAVAMVLPVAGAGSAEVRIEDLQHINPNNVKYPGSSSFGFRPVSATVRAGGIVTFTNVGAGPHTVTSFTGRIPIPVSPGLVIYLPLPDGAFDSSPSVPPFFAEGTFPDQLNPGDTFTVSTATLAPGTHMVYCKFHPWMVGVVKIADGGVSDVSISVTDSERFLRSGPFFAGSSAWGFFSRATEVKQGTLVVFTNEGYIPHTVTSGQEGAPGEGSEFNSGFADDPANYIYPGLTFAVDTSTLSVGAHSFFCDIHPWMQGTIIVR